MYTPDENALCELCIPKPETNIQNLRSFKKIIKDILEIPDEIKAYTLPPYINTNTKWTNIVSGGWDPRSWNKSMLKIWREKSLKKREKKKIISLLLLNMASVFGRGHTSTHRTIYEFLKQGRGYDIYDDGEGRFGWGIGLCSMAEFIEYDGSDNEDDCPTSDEEEEHCFVQMVKQMEGKDMREEHRFVEMERQDELGL